MLHFSQTTHYIEPPMGLTTLLNKIADLGSLAKVFGDAHIYEACKKEYERISSEWTTKARAEAESKSYRNWPAGGESYLVNAPFDWDTVIKSCDQLNSIIDINDPTLCWQIKKKYNSLMTELFR